MNLRYRKKPLICNVSHLFYMNIFPRKRKPYFFTKRKFALESAFSECIETEIA